MDTQEYEKLVRRLELDSEQNPQGFRSRVMLISVMAYLVLALLLILLSGLVWFGISSYSQINSAFLLFKLGLLGLGILSLLVVTLRAFLTPIPPPEGREITPEEAPQLFKILRRMARKLNGPPIHRVVVDGTFNAAIAQVPRFGLFGAHRNHLVLGLPFLFAMSPKEMLAVLAHEYGHLAGDHGKLGTWIYRQRRTFGSLYERLEADAENSWLSRLLFAALIRFFPYYNAYTFVLSRQQEYEADASASRITSPTANASGLIRGDLLGRWLVEIFWPKLYAQAAHRPTPLFYPFTAMPTAFNASYKDWATQERLEQARKANSDLNDTHPCLRHRVRAMEQPIELPKPLKYNAAEALLEKLAHTLAREFDNTWWKEQQPRWEQYHRRRQDGKRRITELRTLPLDKLDPLHLQELASLLYEDEQTHAASKTLEYLLKQPGNFPKAHWLYGLILLDANDEQGLHHLLQAAQGDPHLAMDCAHKGYQFILERQGEAPALNWVDTVPNLQEPT